jgi:hypothetical protein
MITITASRDVTVGSDLRSVTTMDARLLGQYDLQPGGPFSDRCLASLYLFRDLRGICS